LNRPFGLSCHALVHHLASPSLRGTTPGCPGVLLPPDPLLGVSHLVVTAVTGLVGTVCGMSYSSDLTDEQWALLEPVFNAPGKRGPKHAPDLRRVVDAMLYVSHTGCQWRYLPESFGPWTRVWSQFRRWSRNGTWTRALTVLHPAAREADGRADATPSMVVIDTHLARGASNGGFTFHDRGGPYGREGRQARGGGRRDRAPGRCPGRAGLHP
jgi:transposase